MSNPLLELREGEPAEIVAGDTLKFQRSDLAADYPASAWKLSYSARMPGGAVAVDFDAAAAGDAHAVTVAAVDTAKWSAGVYSFAAYATNRTSGERVTVTRGTWRVLANFATAEAGFDDRGHVARVLAAVEAVIEGTATNEQAEYSVAGRSLRRRTPVELLELREAYRLEARRLARAERVRNGKRSGRQVLARFA